MSDLRLNINLWKRMVNMVLKSLFQCVLRIAVTVVTVVLLSMTLLSCSVNSAGYADLYKENIKSNTGTSLDLNSSEYGEEWVAQRVNTVIQHLKAPDIEQRVKDVYAPNIHFNDTIHTITTAESLASYMKLTGDRVSSIVIDIDDIAIKGSDAYARWTMRYQLKNNKPMVESIGMTHFRFNQQGQLVLHQDYWDGVEGFYRTIPVVGFLVNKVREAASD